VLIAPPFEDAFDELHALTVMATDAARTTALAAIRFKLASMLWTGSGDGTRKLL
jgi:hypothetical protein